jgi:hypothetical protein
MNKANLTLFSIAVLLVGCGTERRHSNPEPTLYRLEVNETNSEGKAMVMTFEELSRDEKTSTVKVTRESGKTVPSVMFVVRGCYDIALARKASYFTNLKEWEGEDGGWMYLIGFSNDRSVDVAKYFNLSAPLTKTNGFQSVKDYDLIFKNQQ